MDPILLVALIGKASLEVMNMVQQLQQQHANGQKISEEQAEALRQLVKNNQKTIEAEWEKA